MKKERKKSLTREYVETLNDVYHEKGLLAAAGYEIKSSLYSLGTRISNFFHLMTADSPSLTGAPYPKGSVGWYKNREIGNAIDANTDDRHKYILRQKKSKTSEGGLEKASVTASVLGFMGATYFSFSNFTGNVIGANNSLSTIYGVIFFFIGLLGAFVYFRRK